MLKNFELYNALQTICLTDKAILEQFIISQVGLHLRHLRICKGLQAVQYADELAAFLCFLYDKNVASYMEVGCSKGGTFFLVDSYLRRCNPVFERSLAIDPAPIIVALEQYTWPNVRYEQKRFAEVKLDCKWDLCLIDGDHSYPAVKADFEKAKSACKIIALHDIALKRSGVPQLWAELKKQYKTVEFISNKYKMTVGIGVVYDHETKGR